MRIKNGMEEVVLCQGLNNGVGINADDHPLRSSARDLDRAFDEDHRAGRLGRERVEQVIAEVRARHGYAP